MGLAIHTIVKLIADSFVFVVEESVGPIAFRVNARLRFLNIFSVATFHIERIVAFFLVWVSILKKKTIRTKFGFRYIVYAFIIQIALFRIWKESIVLWASEIR